MSTVDAAKTVAGLLTGVVAPPAVQTLLTNQLTTPIVGVPVTVVAAAAMGALASLTYKDPEEKRSRLFGSVIVATILGASSVALLQYGMGWKWVESAQGPLAVAIGFVARLWIPAIIQRGKEVIQKANIFGWLKKDGDSK